MPPDVAKILPCCKQFLFSSSGQINLPLPVHGGRLHCLLWCQAARLTKNHNSSVCVDTERSEGIFGDLTDYPTPKAEKLENHSWKSRQEKRLS